MSEEKSKDDIIEQIRRIMRLANRAGTEGEKGAADAAAERLALKHGINLDEIRTTDADIKTECFMDEEFKTVPVMEVGYLTSILRQHFGIILIQHRNGQRVKFEWVGTKLNVDIAKHVTILLLRQSQKDWRQARMAKNYAKTLVNAPGYHDPQKQRALVALTKLNKKAFLDGWFWTIHQKLNEHPLRNDIEQFEAEKNAAEEMLKKMQEERNISRRQNDGGKMSEIDRKSVMMGYEAAQAVNLSRPCSGNGYKGSPFALGNASSQAGLTHRKDL